MPELAMNGSQNHTQDRTDPQARTWKGVYTIVERNGRSFWMRIGIAFPQKDSMKLYLDANPRSGELIIRSPQEWELKRRDPAHGTPEIPERLGGPHGGVQ